MSPSVFTVSNNLHVSSNAKDGESKGNLKYFFATREQDDSNRIVFSVFLKNNHVSIINRVWFTAFIGVANTKFAPGFDEQNNYEFKNSNLGGGSYLSGYTKDSVKFVPESPMEILYFDIPKEKLSEAGSLEFYFGSESIKKISFSASWEKYEIDELFEDINDRDFINFLKYKNHKTLWKRTSLLGKAFSRSIIKFLKQLKGLFMREREFEVKK